MLSAAPAFPSSGSPVGLNPAHVSWSCTGSSIVPHQCCASSFVLTSVQPSASSHIAAASSPVTPSSLKTSGFVAHGFGSPPGFAGSHGADVPEFGNRFECCRVSSSGCANLVGQVSMGQRKAWSEVTAGAPSAALDGSPSGPAVTG